MSKKLFHLIKSMTRSEKIHFTKSYSGKENVLYLALYKIYQALDEYDKASIDKSIKKKWPKKNVRQATIYLENAVINSLAESMEINKHTASIRQARKEQRIYRHKGLNSELMKATTKLLDLFRDSPMYFDYSLWLIQCAFYNIVTQGSDESDSMYLEFLEVKKELPIYLESMDIFLSTVRRQFISHETIDDKDEAHLRGLVDKIISLQEEPHSIATSVLLYESNYILSLILKEHQNAGNELLKLIDLMESNEKFRLQNQAHLHSHYIRLLMIIDYMDQPFSKTKELMAQIKNMSTLGKAKPMLEFSADVIYFFLNLKYRPDTADISVLEGLEHSYKTEIYPWVAEFKMHIISLFSSIYFQMKAYDKSLEWIEEYNMNNQATIRKDIFAQIKFLTALNHYYLGNDLLVPYFLKHTYWHLSKNKKLTSKESWMLSAIRKVSKFGFDREHAQVLLDDYTEKVTSSEFNEYEILDVEVWLKSTIEEKSYLNVLKQDMALTT